jgi:hypothetical protein
MALGSAPALGASVSLPATLDTLLPGENFTEVGALTFSNFSYVQSGDMPSASQITVTPNETSDGLMFSGAFVDLPGGEGNGGSEATLGYHVNGGPFVQVKHAGNPSLSGALPPEGAGGVSSVTETLLQTGLPEPVQLNVFNNLIDSEIPLRVEDSQVLSSPIDFAVVELGFLLLTQDPQHAVTLTFTEQAFVVPEPAGMMLMLLGLCGWGLLRRR